MTTFVRSDAQRIIASHYPGMKFRITTGCTIGVRPVFDFRPKLAWRALAKGSDSAVAIGVLLPSGNIDWNAEIEARDTRQPPPPTEQPAPASEPPRKPRAAASAPALKPREIAARLREAATTASIEESAWEKRREFRFGTLVIRCADHAEAIRKVAAKYERGFRAPTSAHKLGRPSLRRPPNADELLRALEIELADPVAQRPALRVQTSAAASIAAAA